MNGTCESARERDRILNLIKQTIVWYSDPGRFSKIEADLVVHAMQYLAKEIAE